MIIKKFSQINEGFELTRFDEAFNKYIVNQEVVGGYYIDPFGDYNLPPEKRYYGDGIILKNGYKFIQYGGGCSGEDCNTSFIIDNNNNLISKKDW